MEITPQIKQHLMANASLSKKQIMISNFLGGLSWGFGSVVGATIVVAILVALLRTINFVPIVGDFASGVVQQIQTKQVQGK